ncbi:hypothetical protein ACWEVD_08465 [Nocardia thailandica]|uniref:Uncharacterized protein n=1 Tax=Nocardia thailandica TaxID=257275 RepID=A0ABW6PUC0_9NOCA
MTWTDQHQRTDILRTVLARAAVDPHDPALFDGLGDLDRLFGGADGLLAALSYRWENHLRAAMDQAETEGLDPAEAYLRLAAQQPELRAVLDRYGARARVAVG